MNTTKRHYTKAAARPVIKAIAAQNISETMNAINREALEAKQYVILDLSACAATDNAISGSLKPSGNTMNIIKDNPYIKGIILPSSLVTIGDRAFSNCNSLTAVTIPAGVTAIGDRAFEYCSSLTAVAIPAGVTTIEDRAFENCSSLTAITIPASVTTIGDRAFEYCSSLTSVAIPAGVAAIGDRAFEH
jgi:hypothetical protein